MSIRSKLVEQSRVDNIKFADLSQADVEIGIGNVKFTDVLNSRVEEFISFVLIESKLYMAGFMGLTCIAKELPIEVIKNLGNKSITFSISREVLKVLEGKEELKFTLSGGNIRWSFKYGEGYILKTMKPSSTIYDVKSYLDFILNSNIGNTEGKVETRDLKDIKKVLTAITGDPMERNIVLSKGFIYSILPTFAIFQPCSIDSDIVLTENILSNLPRVDETLSVQSYKGFSGLLGTTSNTYYIFKALSSTDLITPYTRLPITWVGGIDGGVTKALGIVSFGEDKELELTFDMKTQTILIKDAEDERNQFIGKSKVYKDGKITVRSVLKNFPNMEQIGIINADGKEHLRAISLSGGQICLLR